MNCVENWAPSTGHCHFAAVVFTVGGCLHMLMFTAGGFLTMLTFATCGCPPMLMFTAGGLPQVVVRQC